MDILSQHEAFLRAIFDAPDDDTPRLVYADFLQENGDEERAEFIRVQCELVPIRGKSEHLERVWELVRREDELLKRFWPDRAFLEPHEREQLPFDRGFGSESGPLRVTAATVADTTAARWQVVREQPELFNTDVLEVEAGLTLRPENVESLFALPVAQRITNWNLPGHTQEMPTSVEAGAFSLIEMTLSPAITTRGVETLAQHRGARRIIYLDLRNNDLDNDAARALVKSPYLDNLKRLRLEGNRLRGKVWQQVIERFGEDVVG